ncbi:MAG: sugar kinase [Clostridium sp.]|jgi:2-dehydro-3-deoxygluconokinase|uniref:sugar kinase n=1 Tax=Clostridium sp. TaxID=1506 RepID=UPI0025C55DCE|nr:sugar kinase [Clostridium sp.]MCH3964921.1 sugar kinase [Clostridium sp.]MCI1716585.1 sugar kinase [Clostridium sp.]MCI1800933.1 sugar kinase [Clostridium sp.]MCI1814762.1 sugar kinase [Clostridium sp.]MCI1871680.1 sugar kinase [Clostridium sp.]
MSEFLTIGEPMTLFGASGKDDADKELKDAKTFTKFLAGAEVNVCVGLSRLGHSTQYITKLGKDPFGSFIKDSLDREGIGTDYIGETEEYFTAYQLKSKVSTGDPKIFYFRRNSAASHFSKDDLENLNLDDVKIAHLTGIFPALSESCREAVYELIKLLKQKNITITFDPNLRPQLWKSRSEMVDTINDIAFRSDIVLPGINEGLILAGSDKPDEIADFYLNRGVKTVIVKLGSRGAFVKSGKKSYEVRGFKVDKVVDTVGAGDGFAVGVITGLLEGLSVEDSVKRGTAIGALAVMSEGDSDGYPDRQQLEKFMNNCRSL